MARHVAGLWRAMGQRRAKRRRPVQISSCPIGAAQLDLRQKGYCAIFRVLHTERRWPARRRRGSEDAPTRRLAHGPRLWRQRDTRAGAQSRLHCVVPPVEPESPWKYDR